MPEELLADQFPQTPPIFPNRNLIDSFFAQRNVRENEIKLAVQIMNSLTDVDAVGAVLDTAFPQRFDKCEPAWGYPCQFKLICHGNVDPLQAGFKLREPHHSAEVALLAASEEAEGEVDANS